MAGTVIRHIVLGLATSGLLAGCVEGTGPFDASPTAGADATAPASQPRATRGTPQDVEAPGVFQVTETALWDGRPSLGGVWVASPDTTDPERVIMRNPANGKSVMGALFRRERDNPGPRLQISSDAAEALGLLAGQPAEISVTAMRREEPAEPAPALAAPEATAEAVADAAVSGEAAPAEPAADGATEATAVAAAALAAVGEGSADAAAPDAAAGADAVAPEAPKKLTWKERRAEAKAKREAAKAAKAAAAAAAAPEGAPEGTAEAIATAPIVAEVETAPLDARSPEVADAADAAASGEATPAPEKRKTRRQIKAEQEAAAALAAAELAAAAPDATAEATTEKELAPAPVPEATPEPSPEPVPAAPVAGPDRPIQIGFFSEEANADRAVAALSKAGVSASARKEESNGKAYWSVTTRGDAEVLRKAKAAGFADAYFLK